MKEKLKPCPFCGIENPATFKLINPPREMVVTHICWNSPISLRQWNSAWCWREIDKLKEIIWKKDEALDLAMKILREWNAGEPEPDVFKEIDEVLMIDESE